MNMTIFTVGHSTLGLDEFIQMLRAHDVKAIADVRQFPRSRRFPHFNDESLKVALPSAGIAYSHHKSLGGRRKASPQSINTGWRNEGFRGFADYMQTDEFTQALEQPMYQARQQPTAIMCAEAVPWRCHRSLIADALLIRGWTVLNIMNAQQATPHQLTPFARVAGSELSYPAETDSGLFDAAS